MSLRQAFLALGLTFIMPVTVLAQPAVRLLTPGTFNIEEVPQAQNNTRWIAVSVTPQGSSAKAVQIHVKEVQDDMRDAPEGPYTGRTVSSYADTNPDAEDESLFFVQGLDLTSGPLPTYLNSPQDIPRGASLTVKGPKASWRLNATGEGDSYKLTQGATVLMDVPMLDDAIPSILWAGDLNSDGIPDLLMNLSWKYSVTHRVLFLSQQGTSGPQLIRVAELKATGY